MGRQAKPLDPRALSAWHDACVEEIHQGKEGNGAACLLATHTGFRKRIVVHYTDRWRIESGDGEKFSLPAGCTACTIDDDGCYHCQKSRYSCEDGFFQVKKDTEGVGREVPVWEEWIDYHKDESRPTELPKWLDHVFTTNDSFGFSVNHFQTLVKRVATRRHDIIADHHEGEVERWIGVNKKTVPDIKPHDLRATWATQCLRAGVEDTQLMDWAGWVSREMVDRYRSELNDPSGENTKRYAKGRNSEGMDAGEKLEKLRAMGVVDEDEDLSADELAEVVDILN